jgi:hypothetical protein
MNIKDMPQLKQMTFVAACRTFFGPLPGTGLKDFVNELKQLTPQDRAEFIELFKGEGIDASLTS